MKKQGLLRTSLAVMCALIGVLALPAAAQAHHVVSSATCALVGDQPTVTLNVSFVGFSSTKDVTGTIKLDGVKVRDVVPADILWTGNNGSLTDKRVTTAGSHSVKGDFYWPHHKSGKAHHTVDCPQPPAKPPAIAIDKNAVESTAVAGTTVNFTIAVTNTGTTSFVTYQLDDPNCDEARTGGNAADANLDPGETWTYSCAMATRAGQTSAVNAATATGTNSDGKSASATDSASIPLTQPSGSQPPAATANPPAATPNPPAGGALPVTIVSGRARLLGPSGCVKRAFRATVRGRSIASVAFYVDGRLVKRFTRGSSFSIKVKPRRYGLGRHRIVARVRFSAESGTSARRLPLTFRRCARQVVVPRFTG